MSTEILGELYMPIVTCLLKPTDISLRVFSLVQLYTAIYLRGDLFDTAAGPPWLEAASGELARSAIKGWFQRPMMRLTASAGRVHYYSAMALSVAPMLQQSPQVVADWLIDSVVSDTQRLMPLRQPMAAINLTDLQVDLRVTHEGYIEWVLSEVLLGKWLHHAAAAVIQLPMPLIEPPVAFLDSELLWRCHHAYVRCDAWLRQTDLMPSITKTDLMDCHEQLIVLSLLRVIDQVADAPLPLPIDFYIDILETLEKAFERFWLSDLYRLGKPVSAFQLDLIMLLKNLLTQLIQTGCGVKVSLKL